MTTHSNGQDLPISIAVWLAVDTYVPNHDIISATQLLKPVRKLVLAHRLKNKTPANIKVEPIEIMDLMKSRKGTAVHEAIENAWLDASRREKGLKALGYSDSSIAKFKVNPKQNELKKGDIAIHTERFVERELDGYWIGGTADFICKGRLSDFKNTSVYNFINPAKDRDYQLQGSIYRWADPKLITDDEMDIIEMYDDWSRANTYRKDYPSHPIMVKKIPLLNIPATERYANNKIDQILKYMNSPDTDIPQCTDEDLWRKATVYKYYSDPQATGKSTKNFDTYQEAKQHQISKGGVGRIDQVKGKVVACKFCDAYPICGQAKGYVLSGDLDI